MEGEYREPSSRRSACRTDGDSNAGFAPYHSGADSPNRQAFTIAHEIGHFVLHRPLLENKPDLGVLFRQPIGAESDPIEKEANCFAANMLVPKHRLNPWDRWQKESVVAQLFGVSEEVVRYRFKDLDRG